MGSCSQVFTLKEKSIPPFSCMLFCLQLVVQCLPWLVLNTVLIGWNYSSENLFTFMPGKIWKSHCQFRVTFQVAGFFIYIVVSNTQMNIATYYVIHNYWASLSNYKRLVNMIVSERVESLRSECGWLWWGKACELKGALGCRNALRESITARVESAWVWGWEMWVGGWKVGKCERREFMNVRVENVWVQGVKVCIYGLQSAWVLVCEGEKCVSVKGRAWMQGGEWVSEWRERVHTVRERDWVQREYLNWYSPSHSRFYSYAYIYIV